MARAEGRKVYDKAVTEYKELCNAVQEKQKELNAVNTEYRRRKMALLSAFPQAFGKRQPHNQGITKHTMFAIRAKMINMLEELYAERIGKTEDINVHFHEDEESNSVTFSIIIPKGSIEDGEAEIS